MQDKPLQGPNTAVPDNPYRNFMSSGERNKDLSEFSPASFEQRLLAYTIDYLFLTISAKALTLLTGERVPMSLLLGILTSAYFVFGHILYQRTLGKQLLGLRVIGSNPSQDLSWTRVYLRETLGRFICWMFLGLGFLSVMFTDDRRGWHDRIGGSRVISLKPVNEIGILPRMMRGLGTLSLIGLLMIGGTYYSVFYTSLPIQSLQERLYTVGLRLKGIRGNLKNGFHVKRMDWDENGDSFELEDLFLEIDSDIISLLNQKYRVKKLSVARAKLVLHHSERRNETPDVDKNVESEDENLNGNGDQTGGSAALKSPRQEFAFIADEIDLRSLTTVVEGKEFLIHRFFVSGFDLSDSKLHFSRVYVDSGDFTFNLPEMNYTKDNFEMSGPVEGMLKASLLPQILRGNVDLKVQVKGPLHDPDVDFQAYQRKILIERRTDSLSVKLNEWSPEHHLVGYWPVNRLQLSFQGQGELKSMLLTTALKGRVFLHNVPFDLASGQTLLTAMMGGLRFQHQRGNYQSLMAWSPQSVDSAWMDIQSSLQLGSREEELSYLYYGTGLTLITEAQKARIDADIRFFSNPIFRKEDLGRLSDLAIPTQDLSPVGPDPILGPAVRKPSSR